MRRGRGGRGGRARTALLHRSLPELLKLISSLRFGLEDTKR